MNWNSLSLFCFSVSLGGGEFALLSDSLFARSDWNQDILSVRAERTLAREAKRASSSGLVLVGVEDEKGCEELAIGGGRAGVWRLVSRAREEFDEFGGESLRSLLLFEWVSLKVVDRFFLVSGTIGVFGSMPRDFKRK